MSGDFEIQIDAQRGLIRVRMWGFYSREDVARYHRGIEAATRALGTRPASQRMICDITGMAIQPQEVVTAFGEVMADPRYQQRRFAMVAATSLARMQAARAASGRDSRIFESIEAAESWLFGTAGGAQAA